MPIDDNPTVIPMLPHQISVPVDNDLVFITVMVQNGGQATMGELDGLLMSLIDYLQEWPGRQPDANVLGQKYVMSLYPASPTNPIPPPPPPEDPSAP